MSALSDVLAALVGGVSGAVVSYFVAKSVMTAQAKERAYEKISDLLADLAGAIHAYWGSEGKNAALENLIVAGIQKCAVQLKFIGVDARNDSEVRVALVYLNQISTGGEFQSVSRTPDEGRAKRAGKALEELSAVIERKRRK